VRLTSYHAGSSSTVNHMIRRTIYALFLMLLLGTVLFFVVIRGEFPGIYHDSFRLASQLLQSVGVAIGSDEVEAYVLVAGFIVGVTSITILYVGSLKDVFHVIQ